MNFQVLISRAEHVNRIRCNAIQCSRSWDASQIGKSLLARQIAHL